MHKSTFEKGPQRKNSKTSHPSGLIKMIQSGINKPEHKSLIPKINHFKMTII